MTGLAGASGDRVIPVGFPATCAFVERMSGFDGVSAAANAKGEPDPNAGQQKAALSIIDGKTAGNGATTATGAASDFVLISDLEPALGSDLAETLSFTLLDLALLALRCGSSLSDTAAAVNSISDFAVPRFIDEASSTLKLEDPADVGDESATKAEGVAAEIEMACAGIAVPQESIALDAPIATDSDPDRETTLRRRNFMMLRR